MDLTVLLAALGLSPGTAALVLWLLASAMPVLAAILPHPAPGSRWAGLRALLDLLAINVGNARNAAPPLPQRPSGLPSIAILALLCGGLVLAACSTTPAEHASRVAVARSGYQLAHQVVLVSLSRAELSAETVEAIQLADAAARAALDGWAAAPADDAAAQRIEADMAALAALLEGAGLLLPGAAT